MKDRCPGSGRQALLTATSEGPSDARVWTCRLCRRKVKTTNAGRLRVHGRWTPKIKEGPAYPQDYDRKGRPIT